MTDVAKQLPYTRKKYEYDGMYMCVGDWAYLYKMNRATLYSRLVKGWSIERALTEKVGDAPYQFEVKRKQARILSVEQLKENHSSRSRIIEKLKQEEVQGLSEYRPRRPHPRVKEKEFNYTEKQMQKLATFGMITCADCQRTNAEENSFCAYCGVVFKIIIQSEIE